MTYKLLKISMIVTIAILLVLNRYQAGITLIAFVFGLFLEYLVKKLNLSEKYLAFVYLALWFGLFGEYGLYQTWEFYDKMLHLIFPIFLANMVFDYLNEKNPKRYLLIVFFMTMGFLAFFELIEYGIDEILNYPMVGVITGGIIRMTEIQDTITDLLMGTIGIIIFLIYNFLKTKWKLRKSQN